MKDSLLRTLNANCDWLVMPIDYHKCVNTCISVNWYTQCPIKNAQRIFVGVPIGIPSYARHS